ncbi:uncharacterized protein LOC115780043 [Archocentrus centrarchus]|uniref:uncharacterized protein LOC115780043 n=1 Tax=Archocentrus centrarchus TaxID=63155 RepID=UPI0011EA2C79|nr:uncharacterized protein LOC115780043 [Archocentrus centrarchus]
MSTMKKHEAKITTVVTAEDFLPAFNGYFEKFSELQWSMIKDGVWDSDAKALLADLISEIIQIAAAKNMRIVLPLIQSQTIRGESPEDVMENINTSLGDSVSDSIASSLNVLKQTCKSAQKLTQMIEEEVTEKVNAAISLLTQSPNLPSDPSIYVNGRVSNIKKLRRMVSSAASCLRRYIRRLERCCMGREDHSSSSDESTTSITTVKSATGKVSSILTKWIKHTDITGDDTPDGVEEGMDMGLTDKAAAVEKHEESEEFTHTEGRAENIHDPISAEKAASELVEIAFEKQESSDASCSPKHASDRSLMISKVRDFFTSNLPSTGLAKQNVREKLFFMFAEKQFEKMRKGLKRKLRLNRKYLISLLNMAKPPQDDRQTPPESSDLSLPGSVPQTPRPESSTSSRTSIQTPAPESTGKRCSPFNFDTIKSYVINLYNKLTKKEEHCIGPDDLENTGNSVELRNITRELTDKIFDLLTINDKYEKPVPVMGRSLSESVISRTPVDGSRRRFSHEVLYVLIEDLVEKYVQKIVLWLENKELDQTIQADLVSGALGDIQDLIGTAPTPTEALSDALEQSGRESAASCPSRPASALSTAEQSICLDESSATSTAQSQPRISLLPEKSSARSRRSASPLRSKSPSLEESSARSRRSASPLRSESPSCEESSSTSSDSASTLRSECSSLEEISATSSHPVPAFRRRVRLLPQKSSTRYRHSAPTLRPRSTSPEERYIRSCHSAPVSRPKCKHLKIISERKLASLPGASKGHITQPSPSEKSEQGLSQVSVSSFDAEKISKNLTSFLLIRIITKSRKQHLLSSKETKIVLDRLEDLVNQHISNIESAGSLEDSMYQFTKSLSKRLIKEFGSPDKVLEAAMAYDSSFDEAVLRNLKMDLGVFPSPPPKKSKISRFCSAVGKAFLKPFRCFCKGSND